MENMKYHVKNKKVLIVAAHPDDEILGCGGTIARLVKEGNKAITLILGEGKTARDVLRDKNKRETEISKLKKEALEANKIIGVSEVILFDFPDNRFDEVALLDIVKTIEKIKQKVKPDIIFTHYQRDLNIDHQIVNKAVLTATRPTDTETVKEIYSFEVLSSTEWNYPNKFIPDTYFDITETTDKKLKAMSCYKSELKMFPHPRSLEGIKLNASYWGMKVGLKYAEVFKCVRSIK